MLQRRLLGIFFFGFMTSLAILSQTNQAVGQSKKETKSEFRDDWPDVKGSLAKVVKVDAEKGIVHIRHEDGKTVELKVKDAVFLGPKGGKADINDERFASGRTIKIVYESGKKVKEVHLQILKAEDKK